jgi:hypothetical protein
MKSRGRRIVLRYYPDFCLDRLRKTSRSPGRQTRNLTSKTHSPARLRLYLLSATLKIMVVYHSEMDNIHPHWFYSMKDKIV